MQASNLFDCNIQVLTETEKLVRKLDDRQYGQQLAVFAVSTIGAHVRHVLEHYQAFLVGLSVNHINYDHRARNEEVENYRECALGALADVKASFIDLKHQRSQGLGKELVNCEVTVTLQTSLSAAQEHPVTSSVARELVFLHGHAIHHFAQIASYLRAMNVDVEDSFGMAPSTLAYNASVQKAG